MANNLPAKAQSFNTLIHTATARKRFEDILGKDAAGFASTVITLYKSNRQLQECDGASIMQAALTSAALGLPVAPPLGQAFIVPYNKQAQFQISAKGLLQLALRSGQYRAMHVGAVYEGQTFGVRCFRVFPTNLLTVIQALQEDTKKKHSKRFWHAAIRQFKSKEAFSG